MTKKRRGMQPAVLVAWTERERGWGPRPDGVSIHLSKEDADAYIKAHNDRLPPRSAGGSAPDTYVHAESGRTLLLIDNKLHDEIAASPRKALRIHNRELRELRDKKRVVTKDDV